MEKLKKLYPNSFDRLGILKQSEYDIKIDPTVPPVQHEKRKVPIESEDAIQKELDYLQNLEIMTEHIQLSPWSLQQYIQGCLIEKFVFA